VVERPSTFFSALGGEGADTPQGGAEQSIPGKPFYTAIRALNGVTGELVWEQKRAERIDGAWVNTGVLATAGGLVFGADLNVLQALDARTGAVLWSFDAGADVITAPVTYSVQGEQMLVVPVGQVVIAFSLPAPEKGS
jgi:outer membrane protein assembly factor BamB